jgi:hypothetical protein
VAGVVTITGLSASEVAGQRSLGPISIQGTVVVGETLAVPFSTGDNTFAVPTGSIGVIIIPPTAATATLRVRYNLNSGDTGTPIAPALPSLLTFPSPIPTSLIINASAGSTSPTSFFFW